MARVLTSRAVHHRPRDHGPRTRTDRRDDLLPDLLYGGVRPREEILSGLPAADVDRADPSTAVVLHPAQDHLLKLGTQIRTNTVVDAGLDAAIRQKLCRW